MDVGSGVHVGSKVGVDVGSGVRVGVGSKVGVDVGSGVRVGVGSKVEVAVGVGSCVAVAVGVGVGSSTMITLPIKRSSGIFTAATCATRPTSGVPMIWVWLAINTVYPSTTSKLPLTASYYTLKLNLGQANHSNA